MADYARPQGRACTLGELCAEFIKLHVSTRCKPGTRYSYERIFDRSVVPFFGSNTPASSLGHREIAVFVSGLAEVGISAKTINCRVGALRACLAWGERQGYDVRSPSFEALPEKAAEVDRTLTPHEVKAIYAAFENPEFADMFLVAIHTGLRNGELRALRWADVHWKTRVLDVRGNLATGAYIAPTGQRDTPKGGVIRDMPIHSDLFRVLQRQRARSTQDGLVFAQSGGKEWTRRQTYTALVNARKAAGKRYSDVHWHTCRHTFATVCLQRGLPMIVVQALMGHTDARLTARYGHVQAHVHAAATEVLNGLYA